MLTVKPVKAGMTIETFTIVIGNLRNNGATMQLAWENTVVPVKIEMDTDAAVFANIDRAMGGPSARDYYTAATYYHDSGKDLEQALEWCQKANEMSPRFWQVRREALIMADMERYEDAIANATKSKEMAQEAENMDYVRMNEKSIKEWTAMLEKSGERSAKKAGMKKMKKRGEEVLVENW